MTCTPCFSRVPTHIHNRGASPGHSFSNVILPHPHISLSPWSWSRDQCGVHGSRKSHSLVPTRGDFSPRHCLRLPSIKGLLSYPWIITHILISSPHRAMPSKPVLSFPRLPDRLDRSLIRSHPSQDSSEFSQQAFKLALREFEEQNPDYVADAELSALRPIEFSRLKSSGIVYVDYMGGSLYPESLVSRHLDLLKTGVFGNTHSDSPTYATFC